MYNLRRAIKVHPCKLHPEQFAATCNDCYTLAEEQQRRQLERERKQAHEIYLTNLTKQEHS